MNNEPDAVVAVVGAGVLGDAVAAELASLGCGVLRREGHPDLHDLDGVASLVVTADDDERNVELALSVHLRRPSLPIVVRVFDPSLERFLARTAPGIVALSMSGVAAPTIAAALDGEPGVRRAPWRWRRDVPWLHADRFFAGVAAVLLGLTVGGTALFSSTMQLTLVDGLYFVATTLSTTGYGDYSPKDAAPWVKLAAVGFMALGVTTVALFNAVLTEWVLARRRDVEMGHVPSRQRDHIVIVGAGHLTHRVAHTLRERSLSAVVVERSAEAQAVGPLRADGHHVIVADATREDALRLAGVDRARTVVVLTSDDACNLHVALQVRSINDRARVVVRIDSPLLAGHVAAHDGLEPVSPLTLAAREFARIAASRSR